MRLEFRKTLFAFAAASAFGAFVPAHSATPAASAYLDGYVRVVSNSQELFCDKERQGHFLLEVCYTRAQLKERLLAHNRPAGTSTVGAPALVPQPSFSIGSGRPGI